MLISAALAAACMSAPIAAPPAYAVEGVTVSVQDGFFTRYLDAVERHNAYLDIHDLDLTQHEVSDLINDLKQERPSLDAMVARTWPDQDAGILIGLEIEYRWDDIARCENAADKMEAAIDEAMTWISGDMSDAEKTKALHDYLCQHCRSAVPNDPAVLKTEAVAALAFGAATCDGYARAYQILCERAGLKVTRKLGYANGEKHAWNTVMVGGTWYNVDVCWDDPIVLTGSGNKDRQDLGWMPLDTYFLKSDALFTAHDHVAYANTTACTDTHHDGASLSWPTYSAPAADPLYRGGYRGFNDLDPQAWYVTSGAIDRILDLDLMSGYAAAEFGPNDQLTRAQLAAILYNASGAHVTGSVNETGMPDVDSGAWYTAAANWAASHGIIKGADTKTGKLFMPNAPVTREQVVTVLSRIGALKSNDLHLLDVFEDAYAVSPWAKDALAAAVGCGLIKGSEGPLRPQDACTRAEGAAFIIRALDLDII